jgi:AraC-like DNA-binding protein
MRTGLPPTIGQSVSITRRVAPARSIRRLSHRDRIDWHDHGDHQLIYPKSGVLIASNLSGTWVLPPRRALWLPAGVPHAHQAHGPTDMCSVSFSHNSSEYERPTVLAVSPLAREAIIALTGSDLPEGERHNIRRVLLDQLKPLPDAPFYLPEPADDRLSAIHAMLHEDPSDTRTLKELGAVVGAAERTLSRLFRAQTGMTFPQWRAQVRLQHALRGLASGLPVTAVAHETGYANASAFVEAFRLATGTTPGAYQRMLVLPGGLTLL